MLRIVAGLLAAVLALLLFCAEAQREAPCLRRDREDLARHVRSTTPSSLCWVPIRNALDVLESDGRLRRVSLLAARSRDGLLSEPTAGARHLCDGASDFGPLYRSSDPSRGGGIGVEVVGLLSRAAFLVTSVCYNRLHHWGGRRFGQTGIEVVVEGAGRRLCHYWRDNNRDSSTQGTRTRQDGCDRRSRGRGRRRCYLPGGTTIAS